MNLLINAAYLIWLAVEPSGLWVCPSQNSPVFTQNPTSADCRPYHGEAGSFQKLSEENFLSLSGMFARERETFVMENQPQPERPLKTTAAPAKKKKSMRETNKRGKLKRPSPTKLEIKIVRPRASRKAARKLLD